MHATELKKVTAIERQIQALIHMRDSIDRTIAELEATLPKAPKRKERRREVVIHNSRGREFTL
jgi:septal ring factor EnvC (AmiA/AmiB activator)